MNLTKAIVGILFVLTPTLASGQTAKFRIEEATIESIQAAILRGELTSTRAVQLYLNRIKAYNGTCVNQPDGISGSGPIAPIKNARQLNALMTLNWMPLMRTIVLPTMRPSSSACGKPAQSLWPRRTWEKWGRRTREAPSGGPSVTLTIRRGLPAPRAAAPERRWRQTW